MKNRLLKYNSKEKSTANNRRYVVHVKGEVRGKYRSFEEADLAMLRLQCLGFVVTLTIEPRDR